MILRRPHPRELHSASAHAGREGCGGCRREGAEEHDDYEEAREP